MTRTMMPFAGVLEFEVQSASATEVVATAPWRQDRCTVGTALHGGYLMALADTSGGLLASLNLPAGAGTSTIESKTNFLRPATEAVTITSTLIHAGRTTIVVQTDITRPDGKLVTRTTQTQAVLKPA